MRKLRLNPSSLFQLCCLLFFDLLFFLGGSAQSFQAFVDHVNSLPGPADKVAAVDSFMMANQELPYIYSNTATFVYRGDVNSIFVIGDFNVWGKEPLTLLAGTDLWYLSKNFELNARLDYLFVPNGSDEILDPNNPNTQLHGATGIHSVLAMPDYIWPWEVNEYPEVPKGAIEQFSISSNYTNNTYEVYVYLPHDYQATGGSGYPTAYFNDGNAYLGLMNSVNVFDNLIDSNLITEVIGVFVTPVNREEEYTGAKRVNHRLFFVNELVPFIDSAYNTAAVPEHRAVIGVSAGGNIATLIGYHHADVFGKIGLHSGYLGYNGGETYNLVVNGEKKDIYWSLVWGSYDLPFITSDMRNFKGQLISIGYDSLKWIELPEGHSFGLFKGTMDEILIPFFPPPPVGVAEVQNQEVEIFHVFPNPSTGQIIASFKLTKSGVVSLKLTDVRGKIVFQTNEGILHPGLHEVSIRTELFPQGIYFLTLDTGKEILSRKLIVD